MNEEGKGLPLPMNSAEQIGKCSQIQARFRAQVGFLTGFARSGKIFANSRLLKFLQEKLRLNYQVHYDIKKIIHHFI